MKKLPNCPDSPNCVSSQSPASSKRHVEPLWCSGDEEECLDAVEEEIRNMRTRDIQRQENRLSCVFVTPVLRFRDDVTFLAKPGVVHVRSASRLGWWDMGANRLRVERLRARLAESRPDLFGPEAKPAPTAQRPRAIKKEAVQKKRPGGKTTATGPRSRKTSGAPPATDADGSAGEDR